MSERWRIVHGDCLPLMRELPDASVHAVVTDPPYGLSEHSPAEVLACLSAWCRGEEYQPTGRGFMGKTWDSWVPGPACWREALRVLKPGGHLLAFAGARTQDLMGMSLRLAGFEIRDCIMWVYGSGFPKSLDVSKAIDKAAGAEREVLSEFATGWTGTLGGKAALGGLGEAEDIRRITAPATPEAERWHGWGTALKPAYEPIIVARKPIVGTVAANVLAHGTGGINIDGCRVESGGGTARPPLSTNKHEGWQRPWNSDEASRAGVEARREVAHDKRDELGRWPANLAHDGSPEALAGFPAEAPGQQGALNGREPRNGSVYGQMGPAAACTPRGDSGSAARFFYCAKASKEDRDEGTEGANAHPTVKPTDLMRWLVRLVTPPGGVVLDPFCGSGSTGKAALLECFRFIGIEREEASAETARMRLAHAQATPVQLDIFATTETATGEPVRVAGGQLDMFGVAS